MGAGLALGEAVCAWASSLGTFFSCSHDFIGEFTTSYRELARGQSQFNIYEVRLSRGGVSSPEGSGS